MHVRITQKVEELGGVLHGSIGVARAIVVIVVQAVVEKLVVIEGKSQLLYPLIASLFGGLVGIEPLGRKEYFCGHFVDVGEDVSGVGQPCCLVCLLVPQEELQLRNRLPSIVIICSGYLLHHLVVLREALEPADLAHSRD